MDVESRIFEKLDKIEDRITDLCIRLSAIETEYRDHITEIQHEQDKKLRRRDYILVIMGMGITIIELGRTLGVI